MFSYSQENIPFFLDEAIQGSMTYLTERLSPGTKVVVLNFSAPTKELSDYIIDDLNGNIVNSRIFTAVDRRNLELLQQELKFQMSGDVSDETAQAIGKMLGAQTIISGSISSLGSNYRFRIQATEVETAAI
jgi:TolB-like protein